MDVVRREELQREGTEPGAAVPYSMVPSVAWHFQLGICTVALAWENGPFSPSTGSRRGPALGQTQREQEGTCRGELCREEG